MKDGYECDNGAVYFISDKLIAEGKGGYYVHNVFVNSGRKREKYGPFYDDGMLGPCRYEC